MHCPLFVLYLQKWNRKLKKSNTSGNLKEHLNKYSNKQQRNAEKNGSNKSTGIQLRSNMDFR